MWETEDLSAAYHATCTAPNKSCQGLRLELGNQSRHLVVGSDFLPLNALTDFSGSSYLWTPLVRMLTTGTVYDGDVAFPLAFNQQTWPRLNGSDCKASKDQKLSSIVANHYYADHALQPTYTAALMWLFKYGTMREVISVNGSSTPSLAFAQNIQIKAVLACTPLNSVLFTAAGCAVVILASLYISCKSIGGAKSESVVSIQGIAQLVVDEEKVPNAFVKCSLPSGTQTKDADTATSIRNYELGGVTLRHKTDARLGRQIEDEDKASV
ncbi:TPA: hypothetical protein N0F65_007112 [Lagenidium giganteum]|uniref:Uncharacterized protein n=1 Tax=Lagenidium giganteum TaxID=4803 RepID=A0AAV2YQI0_9STRA|nr:TPA: hypothetical protein N0F65_007112 [Lagenidium giganteum]